MTAVSERCYCGDSLCPSCGRTLGTYPEPPAPDPDAAYEKQRQEELDDECDEASDEASE